MASNKNDSRSKSNEPRRDDPQRTVLERVQELTWALLDGEISDDDVSLLDTLLLTGEDARNQYIECVQLHTDLMAHFAKPSNAGGKVREESGMLSFLNTGSSTLDPPIAKTFES
jgi:hypothetical protein